MLYKIASACYTFFRITTQEENVTMILLLKKFVCYLFDHNWENGKPVACFRTCARCAHEAPLPGEWSL